MGSGPDSLPLVLMFVQQRGKGWGWGFRLERALAQALPNTHRVLFAFRNIKRHE